MTARAPAKRADTLTPRQPLPAARRPPPSRQFRRGPRAGRPRRRRRRNGRPRRLPSSRTLKPASAAPRRAQPSRRRCRSRRIGTIGRRPAPPRRSLWPRPTMRTRLRPISPGSCRARRLIRTRASELRRLPQPLPTTRSRRPSRPWRRSMSSGSARRRGNAPPRRQRSRRKRRSWPWLALAVVLGVVLSIAAAAILMRQKPQDLAIAPPSEPQQEAPQSPAKIAQRAQPSPAEDSASRPASPAPAGESQAGANEPGGQAAHAGGAKLRPAARGGQSGHADRLARQSAEARGQPRLNRMVDDSGRAGTAGHRRGEGGRRHPRPQDARDDDLEEEHGSDAGGDPYDRSQVHLRRRGADHRLQGRRPAANAQARFRPRRRR